MKIIAKRNKIDTDMVELYSVNGRNKNATYLLCVMHIDLLDEVDGIFDDDVDFHREVDVELSLSLTLDGVL